MFRHLYVKRNCGYIRILLNRVRNCTQWKYYVLFIITSNSPNKMLFFDCFYKYRKVLGAWNDNVIVV